ncbi:MAG: DNA polymerase III subunit gamma/tau [Bacteroidota bacterium]|nr:DNA polymerase III subunit gamma/tau [Bacteroidota bacterium]
MENFIVSARKYRPATFHSVIGQHSVTTTLKNAISSNHLAHAYLFCGPRGVGKTTCARIFAKTLNCFNRTSDTEACNECESCRSFNESRSFNIHELDAASNNSVEDIRNLIDQVRIPPQVGKYSIYIIDEVHMLSNQAFNAFLKTLEEPPAHAFFILATTEKHKIIPTILSRCQIFDFSRIKIEDTVQYLEHISKSESVDYEIDALNVIAQKADGGMRDALSIYDQIVSFSGSRITYKGVIDNLNILDYEYYFRMVDAFLEKSIPKALMIFDDILDKGFDGHNFINGLASHFRDLLVCKDEVTLQLLEVGANIKEQYKTQAKRCSPPFIFEALGICSQSDVQYKASKNQRLHVELALILLCNIDPEKKKSELSQSAPAKTTSTGVPTPSVPGIRANPSAAAKVTANEIKSNPAIPSFSIKDGLKNGMVNAPKESSSPKEQTSEVKEAPRPFYQVTEARPFTQDQLTAAWEKFSDRFKDNDPRMYSTLTTVPPVLKDNFQIEFTLNNSLQEEEVQKLKPVLVSYLQRELSNNKIDLATSIAEAPVGTRRVLNDREKFELLAEKNPALLNFKQQFGLDFG